MSLGDNPHIGQIEIALFDPVDRLFNLASLTCCAKARAASNMHSVDKTRSSTWLRAKYYFSQLH